MYGFVRKPIWIFGHLLTLALLAAFITAGLWQLSRHYEQRDLNEAVRSRASAPALTAVELLAGNTNNPAGSGPDNTSASPNDTDTGSTGQGAQALAELEWHTVEVSGTWSHDDAVLIRNRSQAGFSGCYLAAPFELEEPNDRSTGYAVVVVAGWLPSATCIDVTNASSSSSAARSDSPDSNASSQTAELTALTELASELLTGGLQPGAPAHLLGRVRLTQTRGLLGPTDPPTGRLVSLARVDVARIDAQTPQPLASTYLELVAATPPLTNLEPVDPPETDPGPHLGYTFQYFAFAAIAVVGYPLVIVRYARRQDRFTNDF